MRDGMEVCLEGGKPFHHLAMVPLPFQGRLLGMGKDLLLGSPVGQPEDVPCAESGSAQH